MFKDTAQKLFLSLMFLFSIALLVPVFLELPFVSIIHNINIKIDYISYNITFDLKSVFVAIVAFYCLFSMFNGLLGNMPYLKNKKTLTIVTSIVIQLIILNIANSVFRYIGLSILTWLILLTLLIIFTICQELKSR